MHVMIVACYHPSACMLHFDLVSLLFGTSIPTSNILMKIIFTLVSLDITVCRNTLRINLLTFVVQTIASNCQRLLLPVLYEYCLLLSTTAGPVACTS